MTGFSGEELVELLLDFSGDSEVLHVEEDDSE
jgi:hypothetical protein